MSVEISFTIQGDSEGYVTFECPFCGSEFKLRADEYQDDDKPFEDLFCPYCGLAKSKDNFYTKEVIEKAEAIAYNYMVEQLNNAFNQMKKSLNKPYSIIKMDFKPLNKVNVKELKDKDTIETVFQCECFNSHVKVLYCAGASKVFCPYCGVDI